MIGDRARRHLAVFRLQRAAARGEPQTSCGCWTRGSSRPALRAVTAARPDGQSRFPRESTGHLLVSERGLNCWFREASKGTQGHLTSPLTCRIGRARSSRSAERAGSRPTWCVSTTVTRAWCSPARTRSSSIRTRRARRARRKAEQPREPVPAAPAQTDARSCRRPGVETIPVQLVQSRRVLGIRPQRHHRPEASTSRLNRVHVAGWFVIHASWYAGAATERAERPARPAAWQPYGISPKLR